MHHLLLVKRIQGTVPDRMIGSEVTKGARKCPRVAISLVRVPGALTPTQSESLTWYSV